MQLDFIRATQSLWQPWLTFFFEVITTFGGPIAYVLFSPIVFWLVSTRYGYRMMVLVMLSIWLNSALKDAGPFILSDQGPLYATRPFVAEPDEVLTCRRDPTFDPQAMLAALCHEEETYAFPSGHANTSFVFWGYLALLLRRRLITVISAVMILLIGLSRIYLGQHWPTDVLGGWLIGGLLLAGTMQLIHVAGDRQHLINS
jgi:membrane-associated phospholipid phosphatase